MDPELREYLEGMRKEFLEHVSVEVTGLKAGQEALSVEVTGLRAGQDAMREEVTGLKVGQDAMREEVTGLKAGQETLRSDMVAMEERLRTEIVTGDREMALEVRSLRIEMKEMEQRLTEKIEARKEDADALGGDIAKLQKRDDNLEKRVKVLESKAGG